MTRSTQCIGALVGIASPSVSRLLFKNCGEPITRWSAFRSIGSRTRSRSTSGCFGVTHRSASSMAWDDALARIIEEQPLRAREGGAV
jgi:hypothetical protein